MVQITILGAGITGLTIASQLPSDHKITIVGKHIPGDPESFDYASNWGGACWVGVPDSSEFDQRLQLDAYALLWKIAAEHSDSGLRISKVTEIMEFGSPDKVWWSKKIPGFRFLDPSELSAAAEWGMTYKSIIISPPVFLKWLRSRLEARGVTFKRMEVRSLDDLKGLGHDILINSSGASCNYIAGVDDKSLIPIRLQSLVMKKDFNEGFIYRGREGYYFNIFGRPDGTCYLGGFKDFGSSDRTMHEYQRNTILERGNEVLPKVLPSAKAEDYKILYDIATTYMFRPQSHGGTRIEKELVNGQKVIHAYGQEAGGFTYSFGVARVASQLVAEYVYELPVSSHL